MSRRWLVLALLVCLLSSTPGCMIAPQRSESPSRVSPAGKTRSVRRVPLSTPNATNTILGLGILDVSDRTASLSLGCRNLTASPMTFTPEQAVCEVTATDAVSGIVSREATFALRWQPKAASGKASAQSGSIVNGALAGPLTVPPGDTLDGLVDFGPLARGNYSISARMLNIGGVESAVARVRVR
jgi:hypothetical protein